MENARKKSGNMLHKAAANNLTKLARVAGDESGVGVGKSRRNMAKGTAGTLAELNLYFCTQRNENLLFYSF